MFFFLIFRYNALLKLGICILKIADLCTIFLCSVIYNSYVKNFCNNCKKYLPAYARQYKLALPKCIFSFSFEIPSIVFLVTVSTNQLIILLQISAN